LTSITFATGSNITSANFGNNAFPQGDGDGGSNLQMAYNTGRAGTYTREANGNTWTKQSSE
jgi:dihydroxyacetone kinase-like predicted kinase